MAIERESGRAASSWISGVKTLGVGRGLPRRAGLTSWHGALTGRPGRPRPGRMRVGDCDRSRFIIRVGPRLLMWRPRSGDGLPGDLEIVNQLGPGPYRRALPGLRRVLDQLVQTRIALAFAVRLDPHAHAPD